LMESKLRVGWSKEVEILLPRTWPAGKNIFTAPRTRRQNSREIPSARGWYLVCDCKGQESIGPLVVAAGGSGVYKEKGRRW